jgi:hypothetical protein
MPDLGSTIQRQTTFLPAKKTSCRLLGRCVTLDSCADDRRSYVVAKTNVIRSLSLYFPPYFHNFTLSQPFTEGSIASTTSPGGFTQFADEPDLINVFPAMPDAWDETVFHNLRTEGAFLVSAERKKKKTQWVRIQSLASEPCRIKPNLAGEVKAQNLKTRQPVALKSLENGIYEIDLAQNDELLFYSGETGPNPVIRPLDVDADEHKP